MLWRDQFRSHAQSCDLESGAQVSSGVSEMSKRPIVAGTDGSATAEIAVDEAAELARALGAQVHLVTAYASGSLGASMAAAAGVVVPIEGDDKARQVAQEIVDRASSRLKRKGVQVATHVCPGEPAEVLMTIAGAEDAQMIVVGNHGMVGSRRILGSVPNRVSHHAPCGVFIVRTS
jgi:nucleotide-binding universal stress UspA family protein